MTGYREPGGTRINNHVSSSSFDRTQRLSAFMLLRLSPIASRRVYDHGHQPRKDVKNHPSGVRTFL